MSHTIDSRHHHHHVNLPGSAKQTTSPVRSARGRRNQSSSSITSTSRDQALQPKDQRYRPSQVEVSQRQPHRREKCPEVAYSPYPGYKGLKMTDSRNQPHQLFNQVRVFPVTPAGHQGQWSGDMAQQMHQWMGGEILPIHAKRHTNTGGKTIKERKGGNNKRQSNQRPRDCSGEYSRRRKQTASYQGNPVKLDMTSSLDNLLGLGQINLGPHANQPIVSGEGQLKTRLSEENRLGVNKPFSNGPSHGGHKQAHILAISSYGVFQQSCLRSLASMLLCPQTILPVIVGLFHRPRAHAEGGYLRYLSDEILQLTMQNPQLLPHQSIGYGCKSTLLHTFLLFLLGYVLGLGFGWELGGTVAATAVLFYFLAVGIIYIGVKVRHWRRAIHLAETLSRYFRRGNLLVDILFCGPPAAPTVVKPVKLLPVSLDLADYHDGLEASVNLTEKLWSAAESRYGRLAVRLQWASGDSYQVRNNHSYRKCCCLPIWLWSTTAILSLLCLGTVVSMRHHLSAASPTVNRNASETGANEAWTASESASRGVTVVSAVLAIFSTLIILTSTIRGLINLIQACYDIYGNHIGPMLPGLKPTSIMQCGFTPTATASVAEGHQQHQRNQTGQTDTGRHPHYPGGREKLDDSSEEPLGSDLYSSDQSGGSEDVDEDDEETDKKSAAASSENGATKTALNRSVFDDTSAYTSGERLIPDKPKSTRRKRKGKHAPQSNGGSGIPYERVLHNQCIKRMTKVIGTALVEISRVLSIIDGRIEGRQTRIVVCISDSSCVDNMTVMRSLSKLVVLLRLLNRTVMRPASGGKSNDVTVILQPSAKPRPGSKTGSEKHSSVIRRDHEDTWTSNMMVLVSALNPTAQQHGMTWARGSTVSLQAADLPKGYNLYQSLICKSWWAVHNFCHLPIYLDDEPPGSCISIPSGNIGKHNETNFSQSDPPESSLLDRFLAHHELRDLNSRRCRQLLTMTSFMGRMIKICRTLANHFRQITFTRHSDSLVAARSTIPTDCLITWLCLLVHWPFHASWLSLFLETNCAGTHTLRTVARHHSHTRAGSQPPSETARETSGVKPVWTETSELETSGTIRLDTTLSQLHDRVLSRLASAIESTRMKSISASLGTLQPGVGHKWSSAKSCGNPIQSTAQMMTTLEVCELALQDRDPRRLAAFLSLPSEPGPTHGVSPGRLQPTITSQTGRPNSPGSITVSQLVEVMQLTPFLNPYITGWIKDMLSNRLKLTDIHKEDKPKGGGWRFAQPRDSSTNVVGEKVNQGSGQIHTNIHSNAVPRKTCFCPVKLKHGLPSKPLVEMSVDDVCQLLANIADLSTNQLSRKGSRRRHHQPKGEQPHLQRKHQSIGETRPDDQASFTKPKLDRPVGSSEGSDAPVNEPNPPALSNERVDSLDQYHKVLFRSYENRLRLLNVNGPVLSVCDISELGRELNMSFGDWQLFSALITHLRSTESVAMHYGVASNPGLANPSPFKDGSNLMSLATTKHDTSLPQNKRDPGLPNTVSDTSLALTVKSAPISEHSLSKIGKSCIRYGGNSKSMGNLLIGNKVEQYGSLEVPFINRTASKMVNVYGGERGNQASVQTLPLYCNHHLSRKSQEKATIVPTFCPKHQGENKRLIPNAYSSQAYQLDETRLFNSQTELHNCNSQPPTALQADIIQPDGKTQHLVYPKLGYPQMLMPIGYHMQQQTAALPSTDGQLLVLKGKNVSMQHQGTSAFCTVHQLHQKGTNYLESPVFTSKGSDVHWQKKPTNLSKGTKDRRLQHSFMGNPENITFERPVNVGLSFEENGIHSAENHDLLARDSTSTSFAGELVDEVAQLSPIQMDQKTSTELNSSTTEDQCDCNYWFALEAGSRTQPLVSKASIGSLQPCHSVQAISQIYSNLEREDSGSEINNESFTESVSTTRSQFDISSGTISDVEFSGSPEKV